MSTQDPDDFLMRSGVASASFDQIGDTHKGVVVGKDVAQMRDFETGAPKFWEDGNPMQQLVITLDTEERDPQVVGDEGLRKIYAPKSNKPGSMFVAIREAVRQAGGDFALGGTLAVQFTGEEAPEKRGRNPRKLYVAQYRAPDPAADLLGVPAPAPAAAPAPAPAPAAPPAPVAAPSGPGLI